MRSSYTSMATGGGEWLDGWRASGSLLHVLHKDGPVRRRVHNFRQIKQEETKEGVKLKIAWLPFVCWEGEEYHKSRRFGDDNARALVCPACRMLEYFEQRTDLANDHVIFRFAGSGKEQRLITLIDFLGEGDSADSFKDDFTAKEEFLISLITPVGKDAKPELKFINEKWSLAKELQRQIQQDIQLLGEEVGDPSRRPIAYLWTAEKGKGPKVSRISEVPISPEVHALWEGPPPNSERECRPTNPQILFDAVKVGLAADLADQVPIEELFAPSLQQHAAEAKSFNPEELEGEEKSGKRRRTRAATAKDEVQRLANEPAPQSAPAPQAPQQAAQPVPQQATPPAQAPVRKTRSVKPAAPPPPPPPQPEVQIFECPACGADWPENLPKCPNCGAEAEDAPAETASPPPAAPSATRSSAPNTTNQGGVRKPQW